MRRGRVFGLGGPGGILLPGPEGPGLRGWSAHGHTACDSCGMRKTTIATATPLRTELDRLAGFGPTTWPVLSLYLDMRPDQSGRRNHDVFLRKVFPERSRTLHGDARKSFERDVQRIHAYLESEVAPSVRGLAMFACSGADGFFQPFQLAATLDDYSLFTGSLPHLN